MFTTRFFLLTALFAGICLLTPKDSTREQSSASQITRRYNSTPKGLVMEGEVSGIERITHISYDSAKNRFFLNRNFYYPVSVSKQELVDILEAIAADDRLGVSFTPSGKLLIYGKLNPSSRAVVALAKADRILVSVIFGWKKNLRGIKLPQNWQPEGGYERALPAINVNIFKDYSFTLSKGTYYRTGIRMVNLLLPLSDRTAQNGGYLADPGRAKLSASDQNNLNFLKEHAAQFLKIPELKHAAAIGEVAAFARFLRNTGNLDLKKLAKHVANAK